VWGGGGTHKGYSLYCSDLRIEVITCTSFHEHYLPCSSVNLVVGVEVHLCNLRDNLYKCFDCVHAQVTRPEKYSNPLLQGSEGL
jgi:hypothetical protein